MANEAIVCKKYAHIGVAVDTPNGLLVPVIRDADRKTITEIAVGAGGALAEGARQEAHLDEMSGGVFSISNLGGIGGTSFTPIINQPEVAILGMSRGGDRAGVAETAQFVPRQMLPLSLSYDHRVIDGADAARFLRFVAEGLEQPLTCICDQVRSRSQKLERERSLSARSNFWLLTSNLSYCLCLLSN